MSEHTMVDTPGRDTVPRAPEPPPAPGLPTGRLVLGALLVVLGVLWLLDAIGVGVGWQVMLPAALTVVGVALLATARRPPHGGLVAAGIVLSILVVASSLVPAVTPFAGIGDRVERPSSVAELDAGYSLAMGTLTVDLRGIDLPRGGAEVSASVGMGELVVRLPEGIGAEVRASAGAGEVTILGQSNSGVGVSVTEEVPGSPAVVLDVSVGMGSVEVRR